MTRVLTIEQRARKTEAARRWRKNNPTKLAGYTRKWRQTYPERYAQIQRIHDLRRYGITVDDYEQMLANQNGVCAICQSDDPRCANKYFCVDHDHDTGEVRGLLCGPCNRALGWVKDDLELLQSAVAYRLKFMKKAA